ncbi:hypothetical protein CHS0354_030062 [Potamilus streckersoni]|uniref:leucine--tRNA ligase n=1 Tax=Potamilus streckersoni TaxID=2493646 RepID=A0AAE0VGE6_9BIVA|nr:hypothetical protein CHS0354_030062 [Potamilus streckersoni]
MDAVDIPANFQKRSGISGRGSGELVPELRAVLANEEVVDGKSEIGGATRYTVFTTRPDTVYGATFCVIAPEHPLTEQITTADRKSAVKEYIQVCASKSELERTADAKDKTGIFTGAYAVNPLTDLEIPIWTSDYVLMSYGTGAIMCVPAHDQRDHDFAKKYGLKILPWLHQDGHDYDQEALAADGILINSPLINGLDVKQAKEKIIAILN